MHSVNGQFKISIVPTKKISIMWAIAVSLIQLGRDALMLMTLEMITLPLNRWSSLMRCVRSAARERANDSLLYLSRGAVYDGLYRLSPRHYFTGGSLLAPKSHQCYICETWKPNFVWDVNHKHAQPISDVLYLMKFDSWVENLLGQKTTKW